MTRQRATDRWRVTGILIKDNAMNKIMLVGLALVAVLAMNTGASFAANTAEKACAAEWEVMKTANKIPAGTTWPTFETDCMAKTATVPAMAPAPKMATPAVASVNSDQSRIKTCVAEWDKMRAASKLPAGMTWHLFWQDCDTKLNAAGP